MAFSPRRSSSSSERGDRLGAGALESRLGRVVGDQVDLEHPRLEHRRELCRLGERVVDAGEHHVLDEHLAPLALVVRLAGGDHVGQWVALVDRHQLGAQGGIGRVQRQGQADRHRVRRPAARCRGSSRSSRSRCADGRSPCRAAAAQAASTLSRFIIGSPMPMNTAWSTGPRRRKWSAWSRISDGGQVAAEVHLAGGAERAGQRAARLRGEADRVAPVAVAHQHRLDRPLVVRAEQRLDRAVGGARFVLDGQRRERNASRRASRAARVADRTCPRSRRRPGRPTATPGPAR